MKKYQIWTVALLALALLLTACSEGGEPDTGALVESTNMEEATAGAEGAAAAGDGLVIGFCDMASDESATLYQGYFVEDITALGHTPVVFAADSNAEKQLSQIEDMVTMGVDAIFIRPVSNDSIAVGLQACRDAGITIIGEDFDAETEGVDVFVTAQSHFGYGAAQAEQMGTMLESDPSLQMNVGIVWGMRGLAPAQERRNGFVETIQPWVDEGRVTILDEQSIEGDFSKLLGIVEDWRTAFPEMNCFVCPNDDLAMGCISVLETEGIDLDGFYFYGMDAFDSALESIAEGKLTCSVKRDMRAAMTDISAICARVAEGEDVGNSIDLQTQVIYIDAENVGEYLN